MHNESMLTVAVLVLLTSLGNPTSSAVAEEQGLECASANSLQLADCMRQREKASEERMERALDGAIGKASNNVQSALREEQAAWRAFLDKACGYFLKSDEFGQEGMIVHYPACRTRIIDDRAVQLDQLFSRSSSKN